MSNPVFTAAAAVLLSSLILAGCDKSRSTRQISEPPQRAGAPLVPIKTTYIDEEPSLSADGTRVVFVSGRLSDDATAIVKVFKADWPEGGAPGAPTRLTTTDELGTERQVELAPNGERALISVAVGARQDLYLAPYDGSSAPVRVTDDVAQETVFGFSPDSQLVAWISRDLGAGVSTLKVAQLDADGKPGTPTQVSAEGAFVTDLIWIPAATGYAVAIGSTPRGAGKLDYELATFADFAAAASPERRALVSGVTPAPGIEAAASETRLLLARKVIPSGSKTVVLAGDFQTDDPQQLAVLHEPESIDLASGAAATFPTPPGYDVLSLAMTKDGSTAFMLSRSEWACADDGITHYGTAIVQATPDLSAPGGRIVPRASATPGAFEVGIDYCDRTRADGVVAQMDDKVVGFRVNADATAAKFRMAYVTRFSAARDITCAYKVGDPEIHVLEIDGATRAIHPLSANAAPLESDPRPADADPCPL